MLTIGVPIVKNYGSEGDVEGLICVQEIADRGFFTGSTPGFLSERLDDFAAELSLEIPRIIPVIIHEHVMQCSVSTSYIASEWAGFITGGKSKIAAEGAGNSHFMHRLRARSASDDSFIAALVDKASLRERYLDLEGMHLSVGRVTTHGGLVIIEQLTEPLFDSSKVFGSS